MLDTYPFVMRSASSSSGSCRSEAADRWGVKGRPSKFARGSQASWHGSFLFHAKASAEWLQSGSPPELPPRSMRPSQLSLLLWKKLSATSTRQCFRVLSLRPRLPAPWSAAFWASILSSKSSVSILGHASSLIWYAVLGLLSALVAVTFTDALLGLRNRFKGFTAVPKWVHPAVGGALTGGLAVIATLWLKQNGITGGGYKTLSLALAGSLSLKVMIGLCLLKLAATVCSYSSGGVGGIFAPSLFIGGMLGGTVGYVDVTVLHHSNDSIGAFALVGMGAVFAGIIRAPMTSVLIIFEMTGSYGLILFP